ncbi:phospholipase D-like domain-containing protein [Sphingomonas sp. LY29]|uniref:phospholipase D-like domain-containing protein n=1 Tax=Sphingomonas sp. LY29 TaxID=3095341 RepID=UPI002D7674E3|nr:phospholipase D-like domain-containing protein [Sphingomonas sp. LY29]WRP25338.1 phospholipase D-like domain-containing protein [Sphingomonas sp. LY29]
MSEALKPIVDKGRNCWRIGRATEATVIVDAADYYHHIREAMLAASKRIFIVGWDFDTRIALVPDEKGKGETLGRFFLNLAKDKPERQIDILKWNFGALKQFVRPQAMVWLFRWWRTKAIDFRFDASHPVGCSHHQKIVVIDERLAVCGGIDISTNRWDTSEHSDDEPRRTNPDGKSYMPWHDATMLMRGAVAQDLGELGRERWKTATHQPLDAIDPCDDDWPKDLDVTFRDVDIAIARTRAAYDELPEVREIEALYLDMIAAAKRFIYFENQYFTSGKIAAAIAARMAEPNPPEIVLVMPRTADGWLEQQAMDGARLKLVAAIGLNDKGNRFRVYVPVTKGGEDIYVHAKVSIVDDRLLRVGSSNLNNRSQGLDSECDVIIDAALPANKDTPAAITALRHRLIAEHLGCSSEQFAEAEAQAESMVDAIEALRGSGKTLELLDMEKLGAAEDFIASNEILDPECVDDMFDPIGKRGLKQSWARGRAAIGRRMGRRRQPK